ncbi:hypothetical protein H632_c1583p0 [Helicosporidium sp. ATCC 50920]|nr:hypothetical protein H632_c1583p0 [Helicosporidium sp. ATCC 50920]|eukprot:KDD74086.1 hypothetical protein H632_c1583p0 [Helicosporidium sp. ATCC 50920]
MAYRQSFGAGLESTVAAPKSIGYPRGVRSRRRGVDLSSWVLGFLLVLAVTGAVVTYRTSASVPAIRAQRRILSAALAKDPAAKVLRQPWATRGLSEASHDAVTGGSRPGEADSLESAPVPAVGSSFKPATHELYLRLPALPPTPPSVALGGWSLTPEVYDQAAMHPAAEVLSLSLPRLVHFPSFLSPDEVEHFVNVSLAHLKRSEVVSADTDKLVDNARTSFGTWPPRDEVIGRIEDRIHRLVGIPREFGEEIYVLNYKQGQQYEAHNDHCVDHLTKAPADPACVQFLQRAGGPKCGPGGGGPSCGDRVATFILQLRAPTRGGHTVFPAASTTQSRMEGVGHSAGQDWYCSDERVLGAATAAGDALLFWDYAPGNGPGTGSFADGSGEPQATPILEAMHSGCPVIEGEKWIATRWIRGAGFDYVPPKAQSA